MKIEGEIPDFLKIIRSSNKTTDSTQSYRVEIRNLERKIEGMKSANVDKKEINALQQKLTQIKNVMNQYEETIMKMKNVEIAVSTMKIPSGKLSKLLKNRKLKNKVENLRVQYYDQLSTYSSQKDTLGKEIKELRNQLILKRGQ